MPSWCHGSRPVLLVLHFLIRKSFGVLSVPAAAGDQHRAARHLLAAGRRSMAHGALSSAIATLRTARSAAGSDVALLAEIGEVLVAALALAGEADQAVQADP